MPKFSNVDPHFRFDLQANLTHLGRNEYVPGVGMGIAKCPFDPSDNSTAVWVEKGNPGDLPALYSGTNAEFTKADAVIFRTDLYNYTTGRREYSFKRTLKYDSKWLDSKKQKTYDIRIGRNPLIFALCSRRTQFRRIVRHRRLRLFLFP